MTTNTESIKCSRKPDSPKIYTCSDRNCPVHGDRNRTYGWTLIDKNNNLLPENYVDNMNDTMFYICGRNAEFKDTEEKHFLNKETKRFVSLQFATAWTDRSKCEEYFEKFKENISLLFKQQFNFKHIRLTIVEQKWKE